MKEKAEKFFRSNLFENLMPVLTLILVYALFGFLTKGKFVRSANIRLISNQACVIALIATGAVYIYASGNMNVAMGGTTVIVALLALEIYLKTGSYLLAFVSSIVIATVLMGLLVVLSRLLNVTMQILSMLMMIFFSSLQSAILANTTFSIPYSDVSVLQKMNITLIMMFFFLAVSFLLFEFTPLGRQLKYIGENSNCALMTGLDGFKITLRAYLLCAVGIGLGACAYLIRNASVSSSSGSGLNMDVILAMVLAGSPLKGGSRSKIYAGVIGAFLSVGLGNGLIMMRVDSINVQIIKGVLFIIILCLTSKRPKDLPVKQML